ncbi:MAG: hypothetical protein ACK5KM_00695, partial [Hyphomicrobiaceae bacterium]
RTTSKPLTEFAFYELNRRKILQTAYDILVLQNTPGKVLASVSGTVLTHSIPTTYSAASGSLRS